MVKPSRDTTQLKQAMDIEKELQMSLKIMLIRTQKEPTMKNYFSPWKKDGQFFRRNGQMD